MLTHYRELNQNDKVLCFLRNWLAYDPDTGAYLYKSSGRRKAGRPAFYTLHINNFTWQRYPAYTLDEALSKAKEILAA